MAENLRKFIPVKLNSVPMVTWAAVVQGRITITDTQGTQLLYKDQNPH